MCLTNVMRVCFSSIWSGPIGSGPIRLQNNKQKYINKSILTNQSDQGIKGTSTRKLDSLMVNSFRKFNCSCRAIVTIWNCQKVFAVFQILYKLISKAAKYNGSLLIVLC